MNKFFALITVCFPMFWVFGIHVNDIARVATVLLLAYGLVNFRLVKLQQLQSLESRSDLDRQFAFGLWIFVIAFALFTLVVPIVETYIGRHGIDFPIFVQVIDSISRRGGAFSSLISMEWRNFLSHHFTPFLYIPGLLGFLGIPAFISASIVHGLAVFLSGLAIWLAATRVFNLSKNFAIFCVSLLFANPSFRHGVLFGVHDELFALPFIGFAYYWFLKRRHGLVALMLLFSSTTKESLLLVVSAFSVMAIYDLWTDESCQLRKSPLILYLFLFIYGLIGFVLYAFLQPLMLGKGFDHIDKLASLSEMLSWHSLSGKIYFAGFICLPFLAFPLWRLKTVPLITPCLPLLLIIFVSRFDEMWKPMNYYSVIPTYVLGFSSLITLGRLRRGSSRFPISNFVAALLMALAFCWSGTKPLKTIQRALSGQLLSAEQLLFIPDHSKVIASPAGSLMVLRVDIIWRLFHANYALPQDFDYIVTLPSELNTISKELLEMSEPCHNSDQWLVRCRVK